MSIAEYSSKTERNKLRNLMNSPAQRFLKPVFVCFWAAPSCAQGLFMDLNYEITWAGSGHQGIEPRSTIFKANTNPLCYHFWAQFLKTCYIPNTNGKRNIYFFSFTGYY